MRPEWNAKEEIEACTLAWLGFTRVEISRALARFWPQPRTPNAISQHLRRLGLSRPLRFGRNELDQRVRRLNARGLSDPQIGRRLGCEAQTIFKIRKRLGLPAVVTPEEAVNRFGNWRQKVRRMRAVTCDCCDATCPTYNRIDLSGWVSRPLKHQPSVNEIYCPTCFAEWGWPVIPQEATA